MPAIQMRSVAQDAAEQLKSLPGNLASKYFAAALKRAMAPALARLKQNTPSGPTGNLRRAVAFVTRKYPKDKRAVGLVGYTAAGSGKSQSAAGGSVKKGKDRAFHQGFLEFGTKERVISKPARQKYMRVSRAGLLHDVKQQGGYIASSFNRLGPFAIVSGRRSSGRVQTKPKYPKAFFMKMSRPVRISPMPIGGSTGKPPVRTTYNETVSAMESLLATELGAAVESAAKEIDYLAKQSIGRF